MPKTSWALIAPVLLSFTEARAEPAQPDRPPAGAPDALLRDPAPGTRNGPALRLGTLVGSTAFGSARVATIGGYVAAAVRLGPATIEAEYDYLTLHEPSARPDVVGNVRVAELDRAGISGRVDIASLGPGVVGERSRLVFWLEAGIGAARGRWLEGARIRRTDRIAGIGWLLDHRYRRPLGFPARVGWHFGWRLLLADEVEAAPAAARVLCKARRCTPGAPDALPGMLVSSGMTFSW